MNDRRPPADLAGIRSIDELSDHFEQRLRAGEGPRIETYVGKAEPTLRAGLLRELVALELEWRSRCGESPDVSEYQQRFPQAVRVVDEAYGSWMNTSRARTRTFENLETIDAPASRTALRAGARVGRYEIVRELGSGGFGNVYLATDTRLGRPVALKVPRGNESQEMRRRFLTEARSAARLKHPNIVGVFDSDVTEEGMLYIAAEYVDGGDLLTVMRTSRPPLRQLITWTRDVARALAHAHDQGIIHRDVKPGNVLVDRSGQVYVTDFGLARVVEDDSSLTSDGRIMGTPGYMSPEQAAGMTNSVGPSCDQYSLGVVLYEILTGRLPFRGTVPQILQQVTTAPPPPPHELNPRVPTDLEAVCLTALAKNPGQRYASLGEFADDLDRWLDGQPVSVGARRPGILRSFWANRTVRMFALAMGLMLAIGLLGWGILVAVQSANRPEEGNVAETPPTMPKQTSIGPPGVKTDPLAKPEAAPNTTVEPRGLLVDELRRATSVGSTFSFVPAGDDRRVVLSFVGGNEDERTALLLDENEPSRRGVWSGTAGIDRSTHAEFSGPVWVLKLAHESGSPVLSAEQPLVLTADEQGVLHAVGFDRPVPLAALPADEVPRELAGVGSEVRNAVRPGKVWEGTLTQPGESARRVRLTFTAFRDDGADVRAVLESEDSPFTMATFVGSVDVDPMSALVGSPIRLKREPGGLGHAKEWPVFDRGRSAPELGLRSDGNGKLIGSVGDGRLELAAGTAVTANDPLVRWHRALAPGAVWTGTRADEGAVGRKLRLTVLDRKDESGSVRLRLEEDGHPGRLGVFEGSLNADEVSAEGFALLAERKNRPPSTDASGTGGFFGGPGEHTCAARFVVGTGELAVISGAGERIVFSREKQNTTEPLTKEAHIAGWKDVLSSDRLWVGTARNEQLADVKVVVQFGGKEDELGGLDVWAWITPAEQQRVRILFNGTLQTSETDLAAYPMRLLKRTPGPGRSTLFGPSQDVAILLRMGPGSKLVGMLGSQTGLLRGASWTETIELEPFVPPEKK